MTDIWNTFLVHPLMAVALAAFSLVHDFGLAIILVTVAIRLAVYPLYRVQIKSQRALPELGCGLGGGGSNCPGLSHDDAQNILGFLTSFISNPVPPGGFLDTTAHWLPWLTNGLQHPDPLFILPVVAGLAQLIASVMAMPAKPVASTDPNQRMFQSMAYTFPLMTVVLGAQFPSGLTLYWIATTLFQIVQQYFVSGWGQLPKYLPFLRGIRTPADRELHRREQAAIVEARQDMKDKDSEDSDEHEEENATPSASNGGGRRRGRRRGK